MLGGVGFVFYDYVLYFHCFALLFLISVGVCIRSAGGFACMFLGWRKLLSLGFFMIARFPVCFIVYCLRFA